MVCVPCILLPILLAIYIKFIQPVVFRLLPESWRTTFDAVLYPTCPVPSAPAQNVAAAADKAPDVQGEDVQKADDCGMCTDSNKKDN
ncbi:hypothetical protein LOAG_11362 [Loa loa]|uniref:UPF0729 protein n=1 Tax=Loa loa TaxID=7209 RepID=A0A1I7VC80_LOALO|nr:hypothetical protein LOAG_11362 [Loa loa]EFO17138.1 hypothetical protein LOAG_11362 [Loa loa]